LWQLDINLTPIFKDFISWWNGLYH
jgi:hypothetical protein